MTRRGKPGILFFALKDTEQNKWDDPEKHVIQARKQNRNVAIPAANIERAERIRRFQKRILPNNDKVRAFQNERKCRTRRMLNIRLYHLRTLFAKNPACA